MIVEIGIAKYKDSNNTKKRDNKMKDKYVEQIL